MRWTQGIAGLACVRILLSCTDRALETTTDWCVVGTGNEAVKLAVKVLSSRYDGVLPLFEKVLAALETPWLCGSGGPV